jgi:hypothetical protein
MTSLTPAEEAATTVVRILGDTCTDLGVAKWTLTASRIRVAAARAETGPDLWVEVAPHLRALGASEMSKATAEALLEALDVPGVLTELSERLDLAVLRVRVARQANKETQS